MKCPTDSATLVMSERSGIEIDYCPECRGVWLDRGELDKIIERATDDATQAAPAPQQYSEPRYEDPRYDNRGSSHGKSHGNKQYGQPRRKESWISDLFG